MESWHSFTWRVGATYIGAAIGMAMPDMDNTGAMVNL